MEGQEVKLLPIRSRHSAARSALRTGLGCVRYLMEDHPVAIAARSTNNAAACDHRGRASQGRHNE